MNSKKWCIFFVSAIALSLLFIMATNYFIDPFGYFRGLKGNNDFLDDTGYYMRAIKAEHILRTTDEYDAYLVAGSRGGAIRTQKLKELDGYTYYNDWVLSGNFQDYYYNTKFIIEHANPKKILLQISTSEFKSYARESYGDIYEIPAIIKGTSKALESLQFLFKNPSSSLDELNADHSESSNAFVTGERNLTRYYNAFTSDQAGYYKKFMEEESSLYLNNLEGKKLPDKSNVVDLCLADLKAIKKLCEKNNVQFQVIMAPVFIGEAIRYEGEDLYNALKGIAQITDGFWCFSNLTDYNLNPANFYNTKHYFYETGDFMIDTIKGKTSDSNFGEYITMANVSSFIEHRKALYEKIKQYYQTNKTLPLLPYDHESNIYKESKENQTLQKEINKTRSN